MAYDDREYTMNQSREPQFGGGGQARHGGWPGGGYQGGYSGGGPQFGGQPGYQQGYDRPLGGAQQGFGPQGWQGGPSGRPSYGSYGTPSQGTPNRGDQGWGDQGFRDQNYGAGFGGNYTSGGAGYGSEGGYTGQPGFQGPSGYQGAGGGMGDQTFAPSYSQQDYEAQHWSPGQRGFAGRPGRPSEYAAEFQQGGFQGRGRFGDAPRGLGGRGREGGGRGEFDRERAGGYGADSGFDAGFSAGFGGRSSFGRREAGYERGPAGGYERGMRGSYGGYGAEEEYGAGFSPHYETYARGRAQGQYAGRGPKNYQRADARIEEDANELLTRHPEIDASEVMVSVRSGEVTLTGTVTERRMKRQIAELVEDISGVKDVHNEVRVQRAPDRDRESSAPSGTGSLGAGSEPRAAEHRDAGTTGGTSGSSGSGPGGSRGRSGGAGAGQQGSSRT
jgi:hypothetical protein